MQVILNMIWISNSVCMSLVYCRASGFSIVNSRLDDPKIPMKYLVAVFFVTGLHEIFKARQIVLEDMKKERYEKGKIVEFRGESGHVRDFRPSATSARQ